MKAAVLCFICIWACCDGWSDTKQRKFDENFLFGVSSAAYQIEGGWNEDGKGESIWDRFMHQRQDTNGDVAADSYHNWRRDVEMLRELGVDFYRFSISWPRVLPAGFPNKINEKGLQYYDNLINELLKYNITPMVTLYHADLPQTLQDLGGWTNPLITDWFEAYARVIFDKFGDRVKNWITVNQPYSICMRGYGSSWEAPGVDSKGIGEYLCVKNVMVAHAKAYRLYEKEFKSKFGGSVGISIPIIWADPLDQEPENVEAADRFRQFGVDLYMHPIWSESGDFPKSVKEIIAKKSKEQGFPESRLPSLSAEEIKLLKGSADFLGLNHYTTFLAKKATTEYPVPSSDDDLGVDISQSDDWKRGKSFWISSVPYGLYKSCLYVNKNYNYPPIIITENGWSTDTGLGDQSRVDYIKEYLKALLFAIEDGTNVKGYSVWSLLDNVEWSAGISERFGLYEVDYSSPEKTRTPRLSAFVYKHIIERRVIDDWTPDSLNMNISNRRIKKKDEL